MALFSKKQKTETKEATVDVSAVHPPTKDLSWVLIKPRITEKATDVQVARAYVFLVNPKAGKRDIASAVAKIYNVTPIRVHTTNIPRKTIKNVRTGKSGVKGGGKKAYVYLKEGDSISIT